MVDGLLADISIGVVLTNSFFTSRDRSQCSYLHWNRTCGTWIRRVKSSLIRFHVSTGMLRSRLNIDRGLGMIAG